MEEILDENFIELLDQYLDEEEIESKKESDLMEEKREQLKNFSDSNFTVEDTITIGRFVNDYLEIPGDCSKLYHSGLKDLGSDLVMGVDNNFANKNPELVKQGYLLLVIDSRNKRGTYVNPFYLERVLNKNEVELEFNIFSKAGIHDLEKLVEYYNKYMELLERVENNQRFYDLLRQAHKTKHLNKLLEKRREM